MSAMSRASGSSAAARSQPSTSSGPRAPTMAPVTPGHERPCDGHGRDADLAAGRDRPERIREREVAGEAFAGEIGDGVSISLFRRNLQDLPPRTVGEEVDETVGPLPDVADALAQPLEEAFLAHDARAIQLEAHEQRELE